MKRSRGRKRMRWACCRLDGKVGTLPSGFAATSSALQVMQCIDKDPDGELLHLPFSSCVSYKVRLACAHLASLRDLLRFQPRACLATLQARSTSATSCEPALTAGCVLMDCAASAAVALSGCAPMTPCLLACCCVIQLLHQPPKCCCRGVRYVPLTEPGDTSWEE